MSEPTTPCTCQIVGNRFDRSDCVRHGAHDELLTDVAWDAITGGGSNLMEMR